MRWMPLMMGMLGCAENESDVDEPAPVEVDEPLYSENARVYDFGNSGDTSWFAVNDTVMGGVSSGTLSYEESSMIFEGAVSTDNNGGFTSIRSPQSAVDLSEYDRVIVRLRSEGQPFSMILAHNPYWWQDQYKVDINVDTTDWTVVEIPFSDFQVYTNQGGYPGPTGEKLTPEDASEILHMEFMSKLFEDGPFRFEVDFIAFD